MLMIPILKRECFSTVQLAKSSGVMLWVSEKRLETSCVVKALYKFNSIKLCKSFCPKHTYVLYWLLMMVNDGFSFG